MNNKTASYNHYYVIIIGIITGIIVLMPNKIFSLIICFTMLLTYCALNNPNWLLIIIIMYTSSFFYYEYIRLPIAYGYSIGIHEAIIFFLYVFFAIKMILEKKFLIKKSSLNAPMITFLLVVIIVSIRSIFVFGISEGLVFAEARSLLLYSMFFLIPLVVRTKRDLQITVTSLFVIAGITSVLMVFQFFLGTETRIFIGPEHLVRIEGIDGLFGARVKPPGEQLIFISLLVGFSLVGTGFGKHWKRRYLLFSALLSVGLTITFTRSVWIAAIFGLVVIWYYLDGVGRKGLILHALSVILPMIVIFLAINLAFIMIGNRESNQLNIVTKRLLSVFTVKAYGKEGSFGTRTMEFEKASPHIKSHPILGIGFNNPYRLGWHVDGYYPYSYVHNGYLFILLKMGILGLLSYIWLSLAFLRRATRIYRQIGDEYFKGLVLGSIAGYSGVLLTNITFPTFWEYAMVPCIAIFMGLNEVICEIEQCNYPHRNESQKVQKTYNIF